MVEAPGYCPPGPKCLFHPILYRHSQLPGPSTIGLDPPIFKQLTNRPEIGSVEKPMALKRFWERRDTSSRSNEGIKMKKISFALVGAASLALAACGGQGDDALAENVQENYDNAAENLGEAADNATGTEAATLENQSDALEAEGERKEEAIDDADVNASSADSANAVNAM